MGQQEGADQLGQDTWQEGPTEEEGGQGSGAKLVEPLRDMGRKKEMDQFLREQFEKIKSAVPLMTEDSWEVMQQGTEMMVQLDAPTLCNETQMVETRDAAATDLYRAVRAMIAVFAPGALQRFMLQKSCMLRNLIIWKLFLGSGIVNHRHFYSQSQWGSMVTSGLGGPLTRSKILPRPSTPMETVYVLSDSSMMCHTRKGSISLQPSIVNQRLKHNNTSWDGVVIDSVSGADLKVLK